MIDDMTQLNNIIDVEQLNGESISSMLNVVRMLTDDAEGHDELLKIIQAVSSFLLLNFL